MKFYYTPVSSYSQKALIALYEKGIEFDRELISFADPESIGAYRDIYPIGKLPLLKPSDDHMIPESSIIIEYLEDNFSQGTKLIPDDKELSRKVRFFDRMNDLYLNNPVVTLLFADGKRDEEIEDDKRYIDCSFHHLNKQLADNTWIMGEDFTMADCSAIPGLFYAQKVRPFDSYPNIVAYFERAMERPSFQKVLEEAMPILKQLEAA